MFIATVVVTVLISAVLIFSAAGKFRRTPQIVENLKEVGVQDKHLNPLGYIEIAGALGLLVGLAWAPIGIAAGLGVVLYFVGAIASHLRAKNSPVAPSPLLLVAIAALVLRILTA